MCIWWSGALTALALNSIHALAGFRTTPSLSLGIFAGFVLFSGAKAARANGCTHTYTAYIVALLLERTPVRAGVDNSHASPNPAAMLCSAALVRWLHFHLGLHSCRDVREMPRVVLACTSPHNISWTRFVKKITSSSYAGDAVSGAVSLRIQQLGARRVS
jgi:hypothetical protein